MRPALTSMPITSACITSTPWWTSARKSRTIRSGCRLPTTTQRNDGAKAWRRSLSMSTMRWGSGSSRLSSFAATRPPTPPPRTTRVFPRFACNCSSQRCLKDHHVVRPQRPLGEFFQRTPADALHKQLVVQPACLQTGATGSHLGTTADRCCQHTLNVVIPVRRNLARQPAENGIPHEEDADGHAFALDEGNYEPQPVVHALAPVGSVVQDEEVLSVHSVPTSCVH